MKFPGKLLPAIVTILVTLTLGLAACGNAPVSTVFSNEESNNRVANGGDNTIAGKDLSGYQDLKGNFVIRNLSTIAGNGSGFMDGYWSHPQTKEETRKIGYVEPIPGTDYFIGTGYYPETK